jgi:hypothetical protein
MNSKKLHSRFVLAAALAACAIGTTAAAAGGNHAGTGGTAGLPAATILQLDAVRQATAKYLDVNQAIADGYADIGVFVPGMGWHYLKQSLVDDRFEAGKPELLVYAEQPGGGPRRLVAVEYGVPLVLAHKAPNGFAGPGDVWGPNQITQMWMVHAWVWEWNPSGVFSPTNPRVN